MIVKFKTIRILPNNILKSIVFVLLILDFVMKIYLLILLIIHFIIGGIHFEGIHFEGIYFAMIGTGMRLLRIGYVGMGLGFAGY